MAGLQGRTLGGFQLGEQLTGGGISDVYRGRQANGAGRDVVIKVIYPEFAQQLGFQNRFRQIVQQSGRLANHPHILPLVASGEEGGYLYLVTPYVAAGTLKDWLASGKRFGSADVAPFFRQLCDAVTYAHSLGIAHGNLKPSNVFLFEGRHVLVGDFGTLLDLRLMDLNLAGSGTEAFEYLAPEAVNGQATQAGDIYSIGALLFATLTGYAPFRAATPNEVIAAHARQPAPRLAQANPPLSSQVLVLDPLIQRALAKRPEERFPSAALLAQGIESAARLAMTAGGQQFPPQAGAGFFSGPMPPQSGLMAPGSAYPPNSGTFAPNSSPFPPLAAAAAAYQGSADLRMGAGAQAQGFASAPMGLPAPAVPLAQAAASLAQVSNAFPPLPANATIDAQMDRGRTDGFSGDIPFQPTARVPAPPRLVPSPPSVAPGSTADPPMPQADDWQRAMANGDSAARPQEMPAIRRPRSAPGGLRRKSGGGTSSGPPPQGFLVAGGSAPALGAEAGGTSFEDAPLGDDRFDPPGSQTFGSSGSYTLNGAALLPSAELAAQPEWRLDTSQHSSGGLQSAEFGTPGQDWLRQLSGELAATNSGDVHAHGRPYSATQLGLPRLTAPALEGMPPSWHELASDESRTSGGGAFASSRDGWHEATGTGWAVPAQAGAENAWAAGESAAWPAAESAAWPAPNGGWSGAPMPSGRMAGAVMDPAWGQERAGDGRNQAGNEKKSKRKANQESVDSGFDDDRVWTVGLTAVRRKNRRWVRRLTLLLVLVLLADLLTLVVARPDLCPTAGCRDLSVLIHERLPMLAQPTAPATSPLKTTPAAVTLTSAASKSATAKLTVKSSAAGPISLQATAGISWLSVSPVSVPLAPGGTAQLTVTAKPTGIKPGTYPSTITLTTGDSSLTVPVTIVVTAG